MAGEQWQLILPPLPTAKIPSPAQWVRAGWRPFLYMTRWRSGHAPSPCTAGSGLGHTPFSPPMSPGHAPFPLHGWVTPSLHMGLDQSWIRPGCTPTPSVQPDGTPPHLTWVPDWAHRPDPAYKETRHWSSSPLDKKVEHLALNCVWNMTI